MLVSTSVTMHKHSINAMEVTEAVVQTCSVKKGVLRNFAKFTEQHLCLRPAILFKKRLCHRCFPVNFAKFFIEHLSTEHLRWLLLKLVLKQSVENQ